MFGSAKKIPRRYWYTLGALSIAVLFLIGRASQPFASGQNVILWRTGAAGNVLFARDPETFERLSGAFEKGALTDFIALSLEDKVRGVRNGTRASFLSGSGRQLKVQILDGPQKGIVAYVDKTHVHLSKPDNDEGWTRLPITAEKAPAPQASVPPLEQATDPMLPWVLGGLAVAATIMVFVYVLGPKRSASK